MFRPPFSYTEHVGEAAPGVVGGALGLAVDACVGLADKMRETLVHAHKRRAAKAGGRRG